MFVYIAKKYHGNNSTMFVQMSFYLAFLEIRYFKIFGETLHWDKTLYFISQ